MKIAVGFILVVLAVSFVSPALRLATSILERQAASRIAASLGSPDPGKRLWAARRSSLLLSRAHSPSSFKTILPPLDDLISESTKPELLGAILDVLESVDWEPYMGARHLVWAMGHHDPDLACRSMRLIANHLHGVPRPADGDDIHQRLLALALDP